MEKLNPKELEVLLELVEEKRSSIRKESYYNQDVRKKDIDLKFIFIKLNTQKNILTDIEKENTEKYGKIKKQIKELNAIIEEYEKINKDNTYNFRIKKLTEHIEALESIVFNEDLASDWKIALQEDQEEFENNLDDQWDLEM